MAFRLKLSSHRQLDKSENIIGPENESPRATNVVLVHVVGALAINFYRSLHFSANARSWDRMSSVRLSVRLSVTLVICDHIVWKSWKLIARTISPTPLVFVAKRGSTYSQGNTAKFGGDEVG